MRRSRQIGEDQADAFFSERLPRLDRVVAILQFDVFDLEGLAEKCPGRIVVFGSQLGSGEAIVRRRNIEDRDRIARTRSADETDFHIERGGGRERGLCSR